MSFLIFQQESNGMNGAMLYDADEEWALKLVDSNEFHEFRCETEEGSGAWFIIDRDQDHWGAILRRDDSPYNDCLPPSESLLSEAFKEKSSLENRIEHIRNIADRGFYNPFNAVLGNPDDNDLFLLEQSFQSSVTDWTEDLHVLADYTSPDQPEADFLDGRNSVPDLDEFKDLVSPLESPDGLRNPRAVVHLMYDGGHWRGDYSFGQLSDRDWSSYNA